MTSDKKIDDAIEAAKPSELDLINREIEQKNEEAEVLHMKRKAILSETLIICVRNQSGDGCGKSFPIKDITYIQEHWYIEPFSCTEGDYWKQSEANWKCPTCGHRNRIVNCWTEGIEELIHPLKHLFCEIIDEYDD